MMHLETAMDEGVQVLDCVWFAVMLHTTEFSFLYNGQFQATWTTHSQSGDMGKLPQLSSGVLHATTGLPLWT